MRAGNTHTCDSHVGHRTTKMVQEATSYIKKSLGGGQEDALLFCGSGTTATIKRLQEVMGIAVPFILKDRVLKCSHTGAVPPYDQGGPRTTLTWKKRIYI